MCSNTCSETIVSRLAPSHNLQHTVDISTRIVVLEKGRVVMDGADRQELEQYFSVE